MQYSAFSFAVALVVASLVGAHAQSQAPSAQSSAIVQGSPDVSIGGSSAARQGDATNDGAPVVQGSSDTFINGKPAATLGGPTACGGAVVTGAASVFVNGKPLARAGDATSGCERR